MKHFITISLFFLSSLAFSQITTSITLSEKHQKQLGKIENPDKKLSKYQKFYRKDSLKYVKRLEKLWQHKSDSLTNALNMPGEMREGIKQVKEINDRGPGLRRDDVINKVKTIGDEQLNNIDEFKQAKEIKNEIEGYTGNLSEIKDDPKAYARQRARRFDQLVENETLKLKELNQLKQKTSQMDRLKNLPEGYKKQLEQYQKKINDPDQLKQELKQQSIKLATDHFAKNQDKLDGAIKQMSKLKKKYSSLPNSNDLSTATKRNSLQGQPLIKRLVLGGNLQLVSHQSGLNADFSPVVGYKFDKKLSVGVGGMYRASLVFERKFLKSDGKQTVYGYRSFIDYKLLKSFFAHGEYEQLNHWYEDKSFKDNSRRMWTEGLMFGIGRTYSVSKKVKGSIMLLYNTKYQHGVSPYPNKWNIRMGFALRR